MKVDKKQIDVLEVAIDSARVTFSRLGLSKQVSLKYVVKSNSVVEALLVGKRENKSGNMRSVVEVPVATLSYATSTGYMEKFEEVLFKKVKKVEGGNEYVFRIQSEQ